MGIAHESLYCPFRLVSMNPHKALVMIGQLTKKGDVALKAAQELWLTEGNFSGVPT